MRLFAAIAPVNVEVDGNSLLIKAVISLLVVFIPKVFENY